MRVQPSAYPMYLVTYLAIYHSLSRLVTIHCLAVFRCLSTQASIYFMQQNMLQQLRTSCIPSLLLLYNAIKRLWPSCPLAVQIPLVQLLPLQQQLGQSQLGLRPRIPARPPSQVNSILPPERLNVNNPISSNYILFSYTKSTPVNPSECIVYLYIMPNQLRDYFQPNV